MSRKATAGRPGVPGAFSGPSKGARWLHNSSGICHIVGTAVLVDIASLPYSWEVYPIKIALSGFRTDSNQTANPQHDIPGSEAFRFCRKLFQIAQTAGAQLQFFTRTSHWYPPY